MKVNTNVVLKTFDGQVMKDVLDGESVDATIKQAIVNAILAPVDKENGVEKVRKYELAKRIYGSDEADLNEDEIKLIKDAVGKSFAPIVVGQVFELLKV